MVAPLHIQKINIRHIDFEDDTYSLSPFKKNTLDDSLRESISRVGILHPPIVKEKATDSFHIVAGRQRLLAFREIFSHSLCDCFVLPQDMEVYDILILVLEEIKSTRLPTPLEQAIFLQKMGVFLNEEQIISDILPLLGLTQHGYHIHQARQLLELEEVILMGIHTDILDDRVARDMTTLPFRDRLSVYETIELLRLSTSNQKKFLTICRDIGGRNSQSIAELLEDKEFKKIIDHPESNPPQKTANIMAWLKNKKNPLYSATEKKFNHLVSSLQLPKNITVTHTPFFENDLTTVSVTFKNLQRFREKWQKIKEILANDKN
jgi:hypothetical protein